MDANRARPGARYSVDGTREADNIDGANSKEYIRLRYSTQFTTGGRSHTIEMEVPVPVGASAELREQLIREAEAGMDQLYRRVEARIRGQRPPEVAQRGPSQVQPMAQPAPSTYQHQSPQPPRPTSPEQRPPMPSASTASSASSASTTSTPAAAFTHGGEGPQAISLRDRRANSSAAQAPQPPPSPARPGGSPELPAIPGIASTGSGTMKLSEFLEIIRANWGLSARQAMDLLQVKSLNNMNYRDLLRQLEPLVEQASANAYNSASSPAPASRPTPAPSASSASPAPGSPPSPLRPPERAAVSPAPSRPAVPSREQSAPSRSAVPQASPAPSTRSSPSAGQPRSPAKPASDLAGPPNIPVIPLRESVLREPGRIYKFDEEDDEIGEQEALDEADGEAANGANTPEEDNSMSVVMARIKIDELREKNGSSSVNPGRLVVLHNVLGSQISEEQFQQLIERLWNASSEKKLKQDQVEALISWAKEDYFEDEVSAVLAVLNTSS